MAITGLYENSATISSAEYSLPANSTTLASKTDVGVFQLVLDVSNMANGDQYELKIYEKCRSGDTKQLIEIYTLTGGQPKPQFFTPALVLMYGWDFTLKKIAGTDRIFNWSIRQVA